MTKKELESYRLLPDTIEMLERRIIREKIELERLRSEGEVKDVVSGGAGGIHHFVIQGVPVGLLDNQKQKIVKTFTRLARDKEKFESIKYEVEEFIDNIDDMQLRLIISLRIIENKSWNYIAGSLGVNYTEDSVRQMYCRYLKKSGII